MPTGHLFTFEFNESRVGKAKADFETMGFSPYITVTHRDVLSNGFLLDTEGSSENDVARSIKQLGIQQILCSGQASVTAGSIDAVFLDLPKPQIAVAHAFEVLRKKGKLCNFSPCIEQVQKVS